MKHCGTKRLETERLILRRFNPGDAEAMYRNWASDPEVTRFLTWPAHNSTDVTRTILNQWSASYAEENYYQWAIVLRENGDEPIGSIAAVHLNEDLSSVEIGYCIGKPWWHRGIVSEALKAVMDFFFDQVGAERIEARHDPRNPHSGMVMKRCGMKYEGTMRQADRNNQGICDKSCYALLKTERQMDEKPVSFQDGGLLIRNLELPDAQVFTDEEKAQGWHADISKYLSRLEDQAAGKCVSLAAVLDGHPAGYVNVYRSGEEGLLGGKGIPIIVDLGVLQKYQRRGIGSALMNAAEKIAGEWADTVYLAVGLHDGYGSAQRMYVKRGYIPDGSGVWYRGRPCTPYDTVYTNDDDLVLFMVKKLD